MLLFSKEATNKDNQLKTQMLVSFQDDESKGSEKVWLESGFFGDQRAELTIVKANFPENTFCYINQVLGQLMPAGNVNPEIDLDSYVLKKNEVIMYCPVYNKSTEIYGGLTRKLGCITLQGDNRERFYSYGFNKEKSSLFYCHMKTPLPNIFSCTAFKKHLPFLLDENQNKAKFWNMLFLLAINS